MRAKDKERIWSLHCRGVAASEIDRRMGLDPGTAVGAIVERWKENRMGGEGAGR